MTKYIPLSWILSSSKRRLLVVGTCHNGNPKSAVVVGLLHNSLMSFSHKKWLNLWLTVQIGISDLDLVFVFHSFPLWMNEWDGSSIYVLHGFNSCRKSAEEDATGFAKTFPEIPCVSQLLGGPSLRRGIPTKPLSISSGIRWGGNDTGD